MSKLSPKQSLFVEEYLVDLNATQAAIRAGYSKRTAEAQGCRLLTHVKVAQLLAERQEDRQKRTEVTQDMVVAELAKIGFSDIGKMVTADGSLINLEDMDDDTRGSIASIEVVTVPNGEVDEGGRKLYDHVKKVRMWDKQQALLNLGKHLGMFKEKIDVNHDFNHTISEAFKTVADASTQIGRQVRDKE